MNEDKKSASTDWGSAKDWNSIISGGARGAGEAISSANKRAQSKSELKQMKKRRMAELLAKAMKRNSSLHQVGAEAGDESADYRTQAIQDVARGFAEAFRGARG